MQSSSNTILFALTLLLSFLLCSFLFFSLPSFLCLHTYICNSISFSFYFYSFSLSLLSYYVIVELFLVCRFNNKHTCYVVNYGAPVGKKCLCFVYTKICFCVCQIKFLCVPKFNFCIPKKMFLCIPNFVCT